MDTQFLHAAEQVIGKYSLQAENIFLLSYTGKKVIWAIQAKSGEFILKKMAISEERIRFMLHAIDYLTGNGVYTPGIVRTPSGEGYVTFEDEHFVVFESVRGRSPNYDNPDDLLKIVAGMAEFHNASRGIEIPDGTEAACHLGEWKAVFQKRYGELVQWKEQIAKAKNRTDFDRLFFEHVDVFLDQCRESIHMLDQSCYEQWVAVARYIKTLSHPNFDVENLTIADNGNLYVHDMDSLSIDLPVHDLRKILNQVMKQRKEWDLHLFLNMTKAYQEMHSLTKGQYFVLTADLLFPHLFHDQVSKYYQNRPPKWTELKHISRLKDLIATEISKEKVLRSFLNRLDEVVLHG
ncbi:CotS family spore coat protein [Effusibacillus consociatus]|uniref:CotS family spore coat protein n=1 Tax=Effusibacillus consociatus TaxID=1117041 RepID=A0ABV9Q414_9BACL